MFTRTKPLNLVFFAVLGAFVGSGAIGQEYPELKFRHASGWPKALYTTKPGDYFAEKVKERSGGKIQITNYYGGALGQHTEVLDLVSKGAVDMGTVVQGFHTSALPLGAMTNSLPATFTDGAAVMRASMKLEQTNPSQVAELERNNLMPLVHHFLPNYRLICTSPIATMKDLQGKKIRTFGNYFPLLFQKIGITPVNVLPEDSYEALKRGSMDCFAATNGTFVAYKLHEVAKYIIDVDLGAINAFWVAMNRKQFFALPRNVQTLLRTVGDEASEYGVTITKEVEERALKTMTSGGAKVVKFEERAALRAASPDMIQVWIDGMEKAGKGKEARAYAQQLKDLLGKK